MNTNLIPFVKGQSGNPNGRPRKWINTLKIEGYKLNEVNDCIQVMMSMTISELKNILEDEDATILEKTIANAMRKSLTKGSLYSIDTLLTRVYGKPRETIDTNNKTDLTGKIVIEIKNSNVPLANRETDIDITRNV